MPRTFTCVHCDKSFLRDPRVKNQKYCNSSSCQNARKRSTERKSSLTSKDKLMHQARNKRWRDAYPAHEYQKQYRKDHPEYVRCNRELQKNRNKKRQKNRPPMIVKTDALLLQPLKDVAYMGFEVKNIKIVKTDALLLQMQSQQGIEAFSQQNSG